MTSFTTVLLVEDDADLLEALEITLRRAGYRVLSAADGDSATKLFAHELPDVALLDMMLPGQSGFQLTRLLKERSDGRVPVAMMSGNSSEAHRSYAFAAGVDRFLAKPFGLAAVVDLVEELCSVLPTATV